MDFLEFQKQRTKLLSEMFDNVGKDGIYPTGEFYRQLDNLAVNFRQSGIDQERDEQIKMQNERNDIQRLPIAALCMNAILSNPNVTTLANFDTVSGMKSFAGLSIDYTDELIRIASKKQK